MPCCPWSPTWIRGTTSPDCADGRARIRGPAALARAAGSARTLPSEPASLRSRNHPSPAAGRDEHPLRTEVDDLAPEYDLFQLLRRRLDLDPAGFPVKQRPLAPELRLREDGLPLPPTVPVDELHHDADRLQRQVRNILAPVRYEDLEEDGLRGFLLLDRH